MGDDAALDLMTPPPMETDSTTKTSTSSGRVASKASTAAIADELAANKAVAGAIGGQGEAETLAATQQADQLANDTDLRRQQAADAAANHQEYLDRMEAARGAASAAEDQFADHKFEDYWSHHGVGKRILAGLAGFAGGVGGSTVGTEAIQRTIDRDFQTQQANATHDLQLAKLKGEDIDSVTRQEAAINASLAVKQAKAHEAVAAQALEAQVRNGVPVDQARTNVAVQSQLAKAKEKRREALQHYDRSFSGTTSRKEVEKTGGAGDIASQRLELQKKRTLLADQERWFKENKGPAIADANRGLTGIESKLFDEHGQVKKDVDPATQQMILMELDKASKGGTATGASMGAVLGHLGGTGDKFASLLEKGSTGGLGRGALNIIARGVKAARNANKSEAADLQKSYKGTYYDAPEMQGQHADLLTGEAKYLGQFGYAQRGKPAAAAAPPATVPLAPGATPAPSSPALPAGAKGVTIPGLGHGYVTSDGTFHPDGT